MLPASLLPVPLCSFSVFWFPVLPMPMGLPRSSALSPGCFVQLCRMFPAQKYQPSVVSESRKPDPAPTAPKQRTPEQGSTHPEGGLLLFTSIVWVSCRQAVPSPELGHISCLAISNLAILCLNTSPRGGGQETEGQGQRPQPNSCLPHPPRRAGGKDTGTGSPALGLCSP